MVLFFLFLLNLFCRSVAGRHFHHMCLYCSLLQPSSVKGLVAGIQFHLRCLDPSTISLLENPSICLLLNGIKREKPQDKDSRLPLTLPLLKTLITQLRNGCFGSYTDILLETVLLTAFYGFLRGGEFTTRTDHFDPCIYKASYKAISLYFLSTQKLIEIGKEHQFLYLRLILCFVLSLP